MYCFTYSCIARHAEVVECLLEHGAKVDEKVDGYKPLHFASHYDFVEIIRMLALNGANLDEPDLGGNTPLHLNVSSSIFPYVCTSRMWSKSGFETE
jgi:ankyrin repeat protein